jgi:AcrR family transcriptional regulator
MTKIFSEADVKERIVETALEQFMANGIRHMTILKLIEPLGISTKTVYKYFAGKEALLEECLNVLYTGYFNELNLIVNREKNPVNTLLFVFRNSLGKDFGMSHKFFHDLNYYYPELQNAAITRVSQKFGSILVPVVERGIAEHYFISSLDPGLALRGINNLYTLITRSEEYKDYKGDPYELFRNLVEVFIRGMCTPLGLKEIDNNPYPSEN